MQKAFQRTQRSRINSSSWRVKTFPVGLLGVLRMIALVCGPKAAANSLSSNDHVESSLAGGRILTKRGAAPERIASGPEILFKGLKTTNSSPGLLLSYI